MSEDKKSIEVNTVSNKWVPGNILEQLPGIDGQRKRAFYLKQKNLVPVSFVNVLLTFFIRFFICFLVFCIIKWFFLQVVMDHLPGIIALVIFGFIGYLIYNRTIVKNAPELAEELVLGGFINSSAILLGFLTVFVLTEG